MTQQQLLGDSTESKVMPKRISYPSTHVNQKHGIMPFLMAILREQYVCMGQSWVPNNFWLPTGHSVQLKEPDCVASFPTAKDLLKM
jgi:hypothetical protein